MNSIAIKSTHNKRCASCDQHVEDVQDKYCPDHGVKRFYLFCYGCRKHTKWVVEKKFYASRFGVPGGSGRWGQNLGMVKKEVCELCGSEKNAWRRSQYITSEDIEHENDKIFEFAFKFAFYGLIICLITGTFEDYFGIICGGFLLIWLLLMIRPSGPDELTAQHAWEDREISKHRRGEYD